MKRGGKEPSVGHNSDHVAGEQLAAFIGRIERLNGEKKALSEDIREVYSEAKSYGLDVKIMRKIISLRAMDAGDRAKQEALIETYMAALGAYADTELGRAALARVGG